MIISWCPTIGVQFNSGSQQSERWLIPIIIFIDEELKYNVIVTLGLFTGLRLGELMGLEWQDIDFDNCRLYVKKESSYVSTKSPYLPDDRKGIIQKELKTTGSYREVSFPTNLKPLLKRYFEHQCRLAVCLGDKWQGTNRLFTTNDGKPMYPYTMTRWFPKFIERHGLPKLTFHGIRHTSATLLIALGVHAKTVSSRLGHSNISTTFNIYGHHLRSHDKVVAEKLDEFIFQQQQKNTV
ncbi:hypothetical protein JCM14036_12680 [Desulfotomaculum defluvii]